MSTETICPSTLDGIKRLANSIKRERGLQHALALDAAARSAGFQNFRHARNALPTRSAVPRNEVRPLLYLTNYWRDDSTGARGRETLPLTLQAAWSDLVTPAQFDNHRSLGELVVEAPDHLVSRRRAHSQSQARRSLCAAARVLQFMDATRLRPSKSHSRVYPLGDSINAIPGHDHSSVWYDPATKRYLFADEPYEAAANSRAAERSQWSERFGFEIAKPSWPGMYNPDGGSQLYLTAHAERGIPLSPIVAALARLPEPIVEATWSGESAPALPPFVSPGAAPRTAPVPKAPRPTGARKTKPYSLVLSRGRRPMTRMPIDAHEKIGGMLKSVLVDTHHRKGAYNPINSVRSELDDWIQCEYTSAELPAERFNDVYYHEPAASFARALTSEQRHRHVNTLQMVRSVLAEHYPDCAPVQALHRKLDRATKSLQGWA